MHVFAAIWMDIAGLCFDIRYMEDQEDYKGVDWLIVKCFKAKGNGTCCHIVPIAGTTGLGISFFK